MKKIDLCAILRKEACSRLTKFMRSAYTLAEVIIVMLIIAVIVAVTIGITKAKLDNVLSYTYYNGYSTLREITTDMLANWDPKNPEYKQATNNTNIKFKLSSFFSEFIPSVYANTRGNSSVNRGDGSRPRQNCIGRQHGSSYTRWRCCADPAYPDSDPNNKSYCIVTCWDGSKLSTSETWNPPECPPKITCWDGSFVTDASLCPTQEVTCWDGSKAPNDASCPSHITCWNGEWKHNTSECPKADCWNGTQANTPSDCPPKVTCWDGSFATSSSNCPSYVTCWDGTKKYNWSECPACTNKPDPLPCGQGWDDHTCQLTGSAKTCPGGQHLNSGCECVLDCPSNLTPCQQCSNETGVVSKNPNINRTCSDETYEWSEEQCKCIISPRTLPRQGANFCKLFEANANIMGNTDVCQGSAIASNTTDFSDKKPDVTLRNGLRIYNMHNDATAIAMLAGNTQGGVYDGVPNTNAYGYTVYIDIDGVKGDSKLWSDVYPFYITLSGKVIPGYDATANPNGAGGDSTSHMQVSVEYENYNSGKRAITWLAKSVPFKEGACLAGYVGDATPYCKNNGAVTKAPNCTTDSDSVCRVKQIKPVKFFF